MLRIPSTQAFHITTTANPVATINLNNQDLVIQSVAFCVTNAGTTWALSITDNGSTAKTLYSSGTVTANQNVSFNFADYGVLMSKGINVVTTGTAGVLDLFITYGLAALG